MVSDGERVGRGFARYIERADARIPAALVGRASDLYAELCETQGSTRLLHGDLQHYNVLRDHERGWLAIDPKGVVGEVEYEVGASLRNPGELPDVLADRGRIERRVGMMSSRLGLDAHRVLGWAFAQAVLSAIWLPQFGSSAGSFARVTIGCLKVQTWGQACSDPTEGGRGCAKTAL